MTPAVAITFAVFYVAGMVLAANLRRTATIVGNYLIGRRRLPFASFPHRRERLTRAFGCAVCLGIATGAKGYLGDSPWLTLASVFAGLGPPIVVWAVTNDMHGTEVPDDEANKHFF